MALPHFFQIKSIKENENNSKRLQNVTEHRKKYSLINPNVDAPYYSLKVFDVRICLTLKWETQCTPLSDRLYLKNYGE